MPLIRTSSVYAISKGANDYLVKGTMDFAQLQRRLDPFLTVPRAAPPAAENT